MFHICLISEQHERHYEVHFFPFANLNICQAILNGHWQWWDDMMNRAEVKVNEKRKRNEIIKNWVWPTNVRMAAWNNIHFYSVFILILYVCGCGVTAPEITGSHCVCVCVSHPLAESYGFIPFISMRAKERGFHQINSLTIIVVVTHPPMCVCVLCVVYKWPVACVDWMIERIDAELLLLLLQH